MPTTEKLAIDRANLDAAIALIRKAFPDATAVAFETSDQQVGYGFWISSLATPTWGTLDMGAPFLALQDAVAEHLHDIDWDGVMAEDAHGSVTIDLTVGE